MNMFVVVGAAKRSVRYDGKSYPSMAHQCVTTVLAVYSHIPIQTVHVAGGGAKQSVVL